MSVPIAVTGEMPKTRISSGVISDAPPMPVMPTRRPMPKPNTTIVGSISFGLCRSSYSGEGREGGNGSDVRGVARARFALTRHPGVRVIGQLADRLRQVARGQVGERHLLEHGAQVGPHRDPDLAQVLGMTPVLGRLGRRVLDV